MNKIPFYLAAILACGAALAQAPAGSGARQPHEINPNASGGAAQAKREMKADAKGANSGGSAAATTTMGHKAMDTNGDGFVSRKEWNAYHGKTWAGFKTNQQGMVPWADVDARMGGTPK